MKYKYVAILLMTLVVSPCWAPIFEDDEFEEVVTTEPKGDIDATTQVKLLAGETGVNVSGFDIAGIMLGMHFEDIQTLFFHNKSLYVPRKQNSIIYTLHDNWRDNLDYECRGQGIIIPADVEKCVMSLARARGLLYASEIHLERENTGEEIVVYLTSNATDNQVYRVEYSNDAGVADGPSQKHQNQRDKKLAAFWHNVLEKYGEPNASGNVWATSANSYEPTLAAYAGGLILEDPGLFASDMAKNETKSRQSFKSKPYAF